MKRPEDYAITELISQRPPMIMIDRLTFTDESSARGRLYIKPSNLFCSEGLFQEAGLIEFIGQTAAAHNAFLRLSEGNDTARGFLVQIKDFKVRTLPATDTEIQSEIIIGDELLGYTVIHGKVLQNNSVIAEGELRTLTKPPASE